MKTLLAAIAAIGLASPVLAAISSPHVAGITSWSMGSHDPMTETASGSGVFTRTYSGLSPNTRFTFKITNNSSWDGSVPGADSWHYTDASGAVTITYDGNVHSDGWSPTENRLGLSTDPGSWTAVGNFQSEIGGGDWENSNPATLMTPLGNGIYELNAYLPAGSYEWKAAVTGSWDSISWDARSVNTPNWAFTVGENEYAKMSVNSFAGTARIEVLPVPEPASLSLVGLGLTGLLARRRQRT